MTLDEQDLLSAALNRLHVAAICLAERPKEEMAFKGALFVIGDVWDVLKNMLKAADNEEKTACSVQRAQMIEPPLSVWGRKPAAE